MEKFEGLNITEQQTSTRTEIFGLSSLYKRNCWKTILWIQLRASELINH